MASGRFRSMLGDRSDSHPDQRWFMKRVLAAFALAAAAVAVAATTGCNARSADTSGIEPPLAREKGRFKAIDNHAHPVRPTAAGAQPDDEFDALPVNNLDRKSVV